MSLRKKTRDAFILRGFEVHDCPEEDAIYWLLKLDDETRKLREQRDESVRLLRDVVENPTLFAWHYGETVRPIRAFLASLKPEGEQ